MPPIFRCPEVVTGNYEDAALFQAVVERLRRNFHPSEPEPQEQGSLTDMDVVVKTVVEGLRDPILR